MPIKLFFFFIIVAFSFQNQLAAHSFHVGLAFVEYEESEKRLYSTIQLEHSDFVHWMDGFSFTYALNEIITEKTEGLNWFHFEGFVQNYFKATTGQGELTFKLFDVEEEKNGRLFLYLYAEEVEPFDEIKWTFSLLMDHSMEQQNKMELKYNAQNYFAYFFENEPTQTIKLKP